VFPLPGAATSAPARERSSEGTTKPFRRRNTSALPASEAEPEPVVPPAPVVTPRPMSRRGRSSLFLVAGILLAITVLLALRIYKTTVIHRTQPEPVHPAAADSGIRA
jgi:hypothetical protein